MASKVMVIVSTAEKKKALTGIMYAVNAQKNKWVDDIKVIFFGPFENLMCEDEDVVQAASQLLDYQTPIACKFLSDRDGISNKLEELGVNVDYVGSLISGYIAEGPACLLRRPQKSAATSRAGGMRKDPRRGRGAMLCWWSLIFNKNFGFMLRFF